MDLRSLIAKMDAIESLNEASDTLEASSAIANKIRKAVIGAGTDEEAVYDAIADVKDKYQWAEIKKIYPEIEDDILDDFSDLLAPELTHVKKLLSRIGVTLKQDIVDNRAEMAKIKQLESLVDKYLSLKPTTTKESLALSLYESFGYTTITEAAAAATVPGLVDAGANLSAWSKIKLAGGKLLGIGAIAVSVWDGWQQIQALPSTLTEQQRRVEITKIISKLIAEFGTFWVGAIIGGALAGAVSGPGAIVGFIGGGLAANYLLGDDVNLIVDKIVDKLYGTAPRAAQPSRPATAVAQQNQPAQLPPGADAGVAELQQLLKSEGATNLAITGVLDKNTVIAIQDDLIKLGATNIDGTPLQADGKIGKNTAAALVQHYGVEV